MKALTSTRRAVAAGALGAAVLTPALLVGGALAAPRAAPAAPPAANLSATPGVGEPDVLSLTGLTAAQGQRLLVFRSETEARPLALATVDSGGNATVEFDRLSNATRATPVYVALQDSSGTSARTEVIFPVQPLTAAPAAGDIAVVPAALPEPDSVTVTNTAAGDVVRVYSGARGGRPIAARTAAGASVSVFVHNLNAKASAAAPATVYVSKESPGLRESERTAITVGPDA